MSVKTFCDLCKKELTRNVVEDRLVFRRDRTTGGFSAEVIVTKNDVANDGDLCLECLLKMLNQKPKRKYVRKPKTEPVATITPELGEMEEGLNSEGLTLLKPTKKESKKKVDTGHGLPDLSTFTIKTPEPGMPQLYILTIGDKAVLCKTLKEGVEELFGVLDIDRKYIEAQPDSEGKYKLLIILKEGGK